jgi:hypothetical protein
MDGAGRYALVEIHSRVPTAGFSVPGRESRPRKPVIATLTLITLMLPISFPIGTWLMTPSRLLLLPLVPILLFRLLSGGLGKVTPVDVLVLLYMTWRTLAPFVNNPSVALQYAGSNTVIFLGGYLAARASIRSVSDFQWVAKVLATFIIFSLPFAIYETSTSEMVIPRYLEMIPGVTSVADVNYQPRMGFERVQFVFAHPILYGLFCSLGYAIFFVGLRGNISTFVRWFGSFAILACCFFSVSSGPFLATLAQLSLIIYAYVFRNHPRRWRILGIGTFLFYVVVELASNRPGIYALVSLLSFDPKTANVRLILFTYGMAQIARKPLFGVGFNQWDLPAWMSGSLDNFWLANALVFGTPAFFFMFGSFLTGMIMVGRRPFKVGSALWNARLSWVIVMISITLTLATVYIWGEIASLVFFVVGSGVFFLNVTETEDAGGEKSPVEDRRGGIRYSRFPDNTAPAQARAAVGGTAHQTARRERTR